MNDGFTNGRRPIRLHRQSGCHRSASGIYLVELLVAVFISALLAAALADNMSETLRLTNSGQNQIIAAAIGQELVDNARNTSFDTLVANRGTYTLLVNKTAAGQTGPTVNPRPLMLDLTGATWSDDAENNKFDGTVEETIAYPSWDTSGNVLELSINVTWNEVRAEKSYSISTVISRNGIHN